MRPDACVYTVLTGNYEPLGEQPVARESALPFICLTDNPSLASETWEVRVIAPLFAGDHIRNQREFKFHPHRHLPEFGASLYIDNTVRLSAPPESLFAAADLTTGLCLPEHSFRDTLIAEFQAVLAHNLDDPVRVRELLDQVSVEAPHLLLSKPYWSGVLLRDHREPRVIRAMEIWFAHVLRHSRRDQLSGPLAFHRAQVTPRTLSLDNHVSAFHTWPHLDGRDAARRLWSSAAKTTPFAIPLRVLAEQAATLRCDNARLTRELAERTRDLEIILASTTWRAFRPLRALAGLIRRHRAR